MSLIDNYFIHKIVKDLLEKCHLDIQTLFIIILSSKPAYIYI